jgi:hypothetical protein
MVVPLLQAAALPGFLSKHPKDSEPTRVASLGAHPETWLLSWLPQEGLRSAARWGAEGRAVEASVTATGYCPSGRLLTFGHCVVLHGTSSGRLRVWMLHAVSGA